jgi:ElaB/YqjD/DUF883 family membrane-anchored ribosome-binding protein
MSAQKNIERLADDLRSIVRHGEELVKDLPRDLTDKLKDTQAQFNKALDSARVTCRRLEDRTWAGMKAADETVHEKPYQFIGAALAVGVLIGVLISRR